MKKLVEVALFTSDVKRTVDFYRRLLGANPTYVSNESAEFKLGETKLFIHVRNESDENPDPGFPPGVDHIAFAVDDVDKAVAAAKAAFPAFSRTSREERMELLERIIAEYQKRYADVAEAITEEMGAPGWLSQRALQIHRIG